MKLLIAAVALALLTGCGETAANDVPWSEYAPQVHDATMRAVGSGNCRAMQRAFDGAANSDDAHRARWGHGNTDLMGYLDQQMKAAGCY